MSRQVRGRRWLDRHVSDPYVKQAQRDGYRSRAAYKLLQVDERERLLGRGRRVVDLGAAPGGWTQVAVSRVGVDGEVVAIDLLPMDVVAGARVLQGDFLEESGLAALEAALDGRSPDLVLSDLAPALTGIRVVDQARAEAQCEAVVAFALERLAARGDLLIKVFEGAYVQEARRLLQSHFRTVKTVKPEASRGESSEKFLLARGYQSTGPEGSPAGSGLDKDPRA